MTVLARTCPVTFAPTSMVRLPCTFTSPLKDPAIRTWPEPSILPSMVRSAAIRDSFSSPRATGGRRKASVFAEGVTDMGVSRGVGVPDGIDGGGVGLVGALGSFQSAIGQVLLVT